MLLSAGAMKLFLVYLAAVGSTLARFLVSLALAYGARYTLAKKLRIRPFIDARQASTAQARRELAYTAVTILISGMVVPAIILLGWTPHYWFYTDVHAYGWIYLILSVPLMMLVRDTLFYWSHRALHHTSVFRFAHRIHHLSHTPTPLTSLSVHPAETLLEIILPSLVILFLVPKHPLAFILFLWIDTAYSVYGHLGIEILPRRFASHWLGRWINTSVAHHYHHAAVHWNFGYYFLFWDRLMGTLDPKYEQRYAESFPHPDPLPAIGLAKS